MQLKNTGASYGWAAIALHWIAAIGVIWLYFLGENIEHAKQDGLPRGEIVSMIRFHASVGMAFIVFLAARIVSHIAQRQPAPPAQAKYLRWLSKTVMWLFLLMIGVQIITGPLIYWTRPAAIPFFGLFSIPSPFGDGNEAAHEVLETIHAFAPNLFWPLIVLHVAGAAKHLLIDRDDTVRRMLWVKRG